MADEFDGPDLGDRDRSCVIESSIGIAASKVEGVYGMRGTLPAMSLNY